ncbi:unnamed protein product [Hydatigera taeniaeformis]|uniref:2'-phosphotransferase n=1 Tax=Hydatigena taeniaeformis TaxID=6205 RepID=A0A0R3XBV7_HYDTA|nr:unnamed protein product [Hydatigera taeniaeformis]
MIASFAFKGGYLYVDEILKSRQFIGVTISKLEEIVRCDAKGRYELNQSPRSGRLRIRAVQGHSAKVDGLDLTPIVRGAVKTAVHGTYLRFWPSISKQGLSRMSRSHIHFATGDPGDESVISDMRSSAQVLIYIDIDAAIRGKVKVWNLVH